MKIAITGASGFLGQALSTHLGLVGHELSAISRNHFETEILREQDAIIHLAGASIAGARWTSRYKEEILQSRVRGTEMLCQALAAHKKRPALLISASAIGYYGHANPLPIDENGAPGNDFLAKVCAAWEAAAEPARKAGIRVVHPRIAMVLGTHGGALKQMLLPFQFGLGGILGDGRQIYSWISLRDFCRAIEWILERPEALGPYNLSAPAPVTNLEFTTALGRALKRPTFLPMPALAAKLVFGEMAEALLLNGQKVLPDRLSREGFQFEDPSLARAFGHLFGQP